MKLSIIIFSLFLLLYILSYLKKIKKLIFIFKILTSLSFIFIAFEALSNNLSKNIIMYIIMIGLLCGLIGDIFLGIRTLLNTHNTSLFIIGITFFTLGHISYIISSLCNYNNFYLKDYIFIVIFMLVILSLVKAIKFNFQKTIIVNYTYISLSSLLLAFTFLNYLYIPSDFTLIFFLGVLLFVISDFLLSFLYFYHLKPIHINYLKILNILTYFFGQALIAYSILYL